MLSRNTLCHVLRHEELNCKRDVYIVSRYA